jgi:uncharacterized protein (TIGR03435 family)
MSNRSPLKLSFAKRAGLATALVVAIAIPFMLGAAERLMFEVASVRPHNGSSDPGQNMQAMTLKYLPGGRLSAKSITIPGLIFEAYGVIPGPSGRLSVDSEFQKAMERGIEFAFYDVEAVAPKDAIPVNASPSLQRERLRLMLQTLLEDRFKVRVRREIREVSVYAMVVGRNGVKLQKSPMDPTRCIETATEKPLAFRLFTGLDPASCHSFAGGPRVGIRSEAIDMTDLAAIVERYSDRPVLDKTGLSGLYRIAIPGWDQYMPQEPKPDSPEPADSLRPTLVALLGDQGLNLESTKASVEMFVVEHFERPAEN